ncbi:MAG: carboxypeptidase-like regulatory domain-containing protein [Myxococcota bacterium]|nr:carboxypeptidase-like regulatory domain-containing protein [Myxococcota bacterium]
MHVNQLIPIGLALCLVHSACSISATTDSERTVECRERMDCIKGNICYQGQCVPAMDGQILDIDKIYFDLSVPPRSSYVSQADQMSPRLNEDLQNLEIELLPTTTVKIDWPNSNTALNGELHVFPESPGALAEIASQKKATFTSISTKEDTYLDLVPGAYRFRLSKITNQFSGEAHPPLEIGIIDIRANHPPISLDYTSDTDSKKIGGKIQLLGLPPDAESTIFAYIDDPTFGIRQVSNTASLVPYESFALSIISGLEKVNFMVEIETANMTLIARFLDHSTSTPETAISLEYDFREIPININLNAQSVDVPLTGTLLLEGCLSESPKTVVSATGSVQIDSPLNQRTRLPIGRYQSMWIPRDKSLSAITSLFCIGEPNLNTPCTQTEKRETQLSINLLPAQAIRGTISDALSQPVRNAEIQVEYPIHRQTRSFSTTTNAEGSFSLTIDHLSELQDISNIRLSVSPTPGQIAPRITRSIALNSLTSMLSFSLPAPLFLPGQVTSSLGNPVKDVTVFGYQYWQEEQKMELVGVSTTNKNGEFVLLLPINER